MAGLFDRIIDFIFDKNEKYIVLTKDLEALVSELDSYLMPKGKYIHTYDYKELSDRCLESEKAAEKLIRTFHLFRSSFVNDLEKAYNGLQQAEKSIDARVETHNQEVLRFLIEEAYKIVGNVKGYPLDRQQMTCVVKDAKNHLVVAGAGTGKTTTILGKIKYLLAKGADPKKFLVVSFTNAAAGEMKALIEKETGQRLYVVTFHKLGYDIIRHTEGLTPKVYEGLPAFVKEKLPELAKEKGYEPLLTKYILFHRIKECDEFSSVEDYREHTSANPPTTFKNEKVKSYGEMEIANFLTQYGVRYIYESSYEHDTRTIDFGEYRPDFYLPDHKIYIEYFGIDRNGQVPEYFEGKNGKTATQNYNDSIRWKRFIHKKYGTNLIECYAYEKLEGTLLSNLEIRLENAGVTLKEQSFADIMRNTGQDENKLFSVLSTTIATVITLCKNRRLTAEGLLALCNNTKDRYLGSIVIPIFRAYEEMLDAENRIDFADMLNHATDLVESGKFTFGFENVIVDEYQDISAPQYRMLQALRKIHPYALFCVGDDWQSIYRFAGSDIGYILDFDRYWGNTELSRIETTYRFSQKLIDISGRFIMQNPNQIKKYLRSGMPPEKSVLGGINGADEGDILRGIREALDDLPQDATVFFLGRYNFDADMLKKSFDVRYDNRDSSTVVTYKNRQDLKMKFYTAHKSKGLQADYVFIINNRALHMGFPSKIDNPSLVERLLEKADAYPDAEERRLYYVAMTRARKKVFIVTQVSNVSTFAQEILPYADEQKVMLVSERWEQGVIPIVDAELPYIDNHTPYICPQCGGTLRKIKGPYGEFYGCSNYRSRGCKYKRKA